MSTEIRVDPLGAEIWTIDRIPEDERQSRPRNLFTIWFGALGDIDVSWAVGLAVMCPLYSGLIWLSRRSLTTLMQSAAIGAGAE